ncbi:FadR/GntR family transcriptional regulator [Lentibacillus sediminis]|uniref:FadR/GntR family transcriptional regulator n=1 Tax=Lentibacillus sediminis TaxID=1940529 RepID=UPI000C1BB991|nr:GntR family transcriptional regulator [Lentibacillus sediminis]
MSITPKQKVYQGVLQEIRLFIEKNGLTSGDKLPSERELADTLQKGRSSVREALRAMELLGLIETRQGEGTFLSTYRQFHTVELLASFILRENHTRQDLILAKKILEKEAAKLASSGIACADIDELSAIIREKAGSPEQRHTAFFHLLFYRIDNLLLAKVWQLMEEFSGAVGSLYYEEAFYRELLKLYTSGEYLGIEELYEKQGHYKCKK